MVSPPVSISRSVSWCNCPKQKHKSQQENISQRLQASNLHLQLSEKEAFKAQKWMLGKRNHSLGDVGPFIHFQMLASLEQTVMMNGRLPWWQNDEYSRRFACDSTCCDTRDKPDHWNTVVSWQVLFRHQYVCNDTIYQNVTARQMRQLAKILPVFQRY